MEDSHIRNFRDFLMIYNQMAELCFNRCVNTLNYRTVTPEEEKCVELCASKHININHRMMSIYMEVQPQIVNRRVEEMNKVETQLQQTAAEAATATAAAEAATANAAAVTTAASEASADTPVTQEVAS